MSISHWGIFPGFMNPEIAGLETHYKPPNVFHNRITRAVWRICDWDMFCK